MSENTVTPVRITDIAEIRVRHQMADSDGRCGDPAWDDDYGLSAHVDRATLLRALDELLTWTDDDQRGLNAAVADAMWYWDDMPMDPDDAISLTDVLKIHLQDNGFRMVRAV